MTCERFEPLLALHVEGDLPEGEAAALEAHLSTCGTCRAFADAVRDSQQALKDLAEERLDPAALAAVRSSVRQALDGGRGVPMRRLPPAWAVAAAAVVALVAILLGWRSAGVHTPPVAERPVVPPAPSATPAVGSPPSAPRVAAADTESPRPRGRAPRGVKDPPQDRRPLPVAATAESTLLLKLVTSDPDIVIYWLVDQNGGKS
jgi:anti-sigma factor RsiW